MKHLTHSAAPRLSFVQRPAGPPTARGVVAWALSLLALAGALFLAAGAVLPAPALAAGTLLAAADPTTETDFVFTGRGWGHGEGMSQWGAWEAAKEGVEFDAILAFYYPGTTLEPLASPDPTLKVRLSANPPTSSAVVFSQVDLKPTVTQATLVKKTAAGEETETVPAGTEVLLVASGGTVQVVTDTGLEGPYDYVEVRPGSAEGDSDGDADDGGGADGRVAVAMHALTTTYDYREYWGALRVQPGNGPADLWVYNFVPLEKYVRDIGEVDLDWAMPKASGYAPEAVKAQAVAARTYAVAKNGTLTDGSADQYYGGYRLEANYPGLARAAEDTADLVLTYKGAPATTFFSAHSGGYTTTSAWSGSSPAYIVSQPDPWSLKAPPTSASSAGPGWNWTLTISPSDLSQKVNNKLKDVSTGKTFDIGLLGRVEVASRDTNDATSHARTIRLSGENGTALVSAASLKSCLGLRSTLILTITGGAPLPQGEFWDVGKEHPYHDQITQVVTAGLMGGYDGALFKPDGSVTRWQFAKIAVNLYNILNPGDPVQVVNVTVPPFPDVPMDAGSTGDESDWVAAAKKAGLVQGVSSTAFAPYTPVRRDQMATMLCRALGWNEEARELPKTAAGFADVPLGSTHWAAATYLKQEGIIQGYPDPAGGSVTVLRVAEPIKRQHLAVILCRVLAAAQ